MASNQQNYLALDLELNLDANGKVNKIIQVGVAIGNINDIPGIQTHCWYIDPGEPIVPYITELTGIADEDIRSKSRPLETVAEELVGLVKEYNTFPNPIQWGGGDSEQLKECFQKNNIEFPCFGHREIDVKTIYTFLQHTRGKDVKGGLRSCMSKYKLSFEGIPHRADVDAYNTLKFYFTLMRRQDMMEQVIHIGKGVI